MNNESNITVRYEKALVGQEQWCIVHRRAADYIIIKKGCKHPE